MDKTANNVVSGSGDGTLPNGATWEPGKRGDALCLDGVDQYINYGNQRDKCLGNIMLCPDGFTIMLYFKTGDKSVYSRKTC